MSLKTRLVMGQVLTVIFAASVVGLVYVFVPAIYDMIVAITDAANTYTRYSIHS